MLVAATVDRAAPMRLPVVASRDGDAADARIMVVRHVDPAGATLHFFTDRRAAKVGAIDAAPRVTIVAYDPAERLQLRLAGTAVVATAGPVVDSAWAAIPTAGRDAYRTTLAPGTPMLGRASAGRAALTSGTRDNFAIVIVTVDEIDSLDLAVAGHRRVHHKRTGAGWHSVWLVP